ncbi:MAG: (Fe-S)-binding protein, partial [Deltaproteobacteria bacterium]
SRSRKIARALVKVLKAAGVSFGIIGTDESCCSESGRKIGGEDVFQSLAAGNVKLFEEKGVKKVIVTSPHCLYTFRNEYPELGAGFEAVHHTELLVELVEQGKLKPSRKIEGRIAYHDPCYLGRHMEVFEQPRRVLDAICTERVEFSRHGRNSLCCGGGGGRIWLETPAGERFGDLRIEDAKSLEANTIATACPYCTIMLEASNMAMGDESLQIKDIAELVAECL